MNEATELQFAVECWLQNLLEFRKRPKWLVLK